jgi:hypothetical protein
MHQVLKARLAYFDSIKCGLASEGLDPQLIYVQIMTHQLWAAPEPGDYFGTSFNNMPKLESYKGVTLAQWLQQQRTIQ